MRALVLGGTGMLGQAVTALWRRRQRAVLALGHGQADVTDRRRLLEWARVFRPEVVINCAAFTHVDRCEAERETALAVNGAGVANVVAAAEPTRARLIQVSSDYVFDGDGDAPYVEDAPTGPRSAYGESKLEGERQALRYRRSLVVRTSWLFGPGGPNFVATIRRLLAASEEPLRVVDDQIGCPTYTPFLALALWDLVHQDVDGTIHYCNREAVSWHGFAAEIARAIAPRRPVLPVPTSEFPRPAPRPAYSVLDTTRFETAVGRRVEPWLSGLTAYLS